MLKFTIFGSRYHMPFFVLSAPIVAIATEGISARVLMPFFSIVLVVASRQWLFELKARPLNGRLFSAPREERYLGGRMEDVYMEMTSQIMSVSCNKVGILIGGNYPEYPIWVYLGAPRDELEIEWIIADNDPSGEYMKVNFEPCAMICQFCPKEWVTFRGMPEKYQDRDYRLFISSNYD
jgi:hypothetical protein